MKFYFFQLRLDFLTFTLAGPETDQATVVAKQNNNALVAKNTGAATTGQDTTLASRCLTDLFSVSNPGGPSPPSICGTNTDEHSKFFTI